MLYLDPPFHECEGITFLPDHQDPRQWYYLPSEPRVETTSAGAPAFQLLKYRGATCGGVLNLEVSLRADPQRLEAAVARLRQDAPVDRAPRVDPVPMVDGQVSMVLLDQPGGRSGRGQGSRAFVRDICAPVRPALHGDHRAVFSVTLEAPGVAAVEAALGKEGPSPICILYALEYLALRPAYDIDVEADWQSVHHLIRQTFGLDLVVAAIEIDQTVQTLLDDKVIRIRAAGRSDDPSAISDLRRAVDFVKETVAAVFFEPTAGPMSAAARATRGVARLTSDAWFRVQTIDYTAIDAKSLGLHLRERSAVRRKVAPQGFLNDLLGAWPPDRFIVPVTQDSGFFTRRTIQVASLADFAADRIACIKASVRYGGKVQSVVLTAPPLPGGLAQAQPLEWGSELEAQSPSREASYWYEVCFEDRDERPRSLRCAERTTTADTLLLDPRKDRVYTVTPVKVLGLGIDWDRYASVDVLLRCRDQGRLVGEGGVELRPARSEATWCLFTAGPGRHAFEYQVVYRLREAAFDLALAWKSSASTCAEVRNPPDRVLSIDRALFAAAVVIRVEIQDGAAARTYAFSAGGPLEQRIPVAPADPGGQVVGYAVTLCGEDASQQKLAPVQTRDRTLRISRASSGHRVVCVSPPRTAFVASKLNRVTVDLRHGESAATIDFTSCHDDCQYFEFDHAGSQDSAFEYRVSCTDRNATRMTSWKQSRNDLVIGSHEDPLPC